MRGGIQLLRAESIPDGYRARERREPLRYLTSLGARMEREGELSSDYDVSSRGGGVKNSDAPWDLSKHLSMLCPEERRSRLTEIIAEQIVPRLCSIHHDVHGESSITPPGATEIADFAALAMRPDPDSTIAYFDNMRARGHSQDSLFIHLLAPTARHLGEMWEQDQCDFIDVTLGVARLRGLLEKFQTVEDLPLPEQGRRALLISPAGEKHLFGVDMVAQFLRGGGWDTRVEKNFDPRQSAAVVAAEWFDVVGVTASGKSGLETVARIIESLRRASLNPDLKVMVGGAAFAGNPGLVARVGADAAAEDAASSVILARKLLAAQVSRN